MSEIQGNVPRSDDYLHMHGQGKDEEAEKAKHRGEQAEEVMGGGEGTAKGKAIKKGQADKAQDTSKAEQGKEAKAAQQDRVKGFDTQDVMQSAAHPDVNQMDTTAKATNANWATMSVTTLDTVMAGDPVLLGTKGMSFLSGGAQGTGNPWFNANPMTTFFIMFTKVMDLQKELARVGAKIAVMAMLVTKELGQMQKDLTIKAGQAEAASHYSAAATAAASAAVSAAMVGLSVKTTWQLGKKQQAQLQQQEAKVAKAEGEVDIPPSMRGKIQKGPDSAQFLKQREEQLQKAEKNLLENETKFKEGKISTQAEFDKKIEKDVKKLQEAQGDLFAKNKGPFETDQDGNFVKYEIKDPKTGEGTGKLTLKRNEESTRYYDQNNLKTNSDGKFIDKNGKEIEPGAYDPATGEYTGPDKDKVVYEEGNFQKFKKEENKLDEMRWSTSTEVANQRREALMNFQLFQGTIDHSLESTRELSQGYWALKKAEAEGQEKLFAAYAQISQRGIDMGIQTKQEADQFFFSLADFLTKLSDQAQQYFSWRG